MMADSKRGDATMLLFRESESRPILLHEISFDRKTSWMPRRWDVQRRRANPASRHPPALGLPLAFDECGVNSALDQRVVGHEFAVQRDGRGNALDHEFTQRPPHGSDCFGPRRPVY